MPDEKKEPKHYLPGHAEDWIFNEEESDRLNEKAMPEVPEGLVGKAMEALDKQAKFEIARKADPCSKEFKEGIESFTGEGYVSPYEKKTSWLSKIYNWFKA